MNEQATEYAARIAGRRPPLPDSDNGETSCRREVRDLLVTAQTEIVKLRGDLADAHAKAAKEQSRRSQAEKQIGDAQYLFGTGLLQEGDKGALAVLEALLFKPDHACICADCDCPRLAYDKCANCEANRPEERGT